MPRRATNDYDVHPEEDLTSSECKKETKRELEARKLKEQIKTLELKNQKLKLELEGKSTPPAVKRSAGQPTKYNSQFHPKMAELFYANGGIDEDFCNFIGISVPTLHAWKKRHPELVSAITLGKSCPDSRVEAALYSSAIEGSNTAQIFWLKNRRPKEWRDKQEIQLGGEVKSKGFCIVDSEGKPVESEK